MFIGADKVAMLTLLNISIPVDCVIRRSEKEAAIVITRAPAAALAGALL